jgi:hypothetical protein
MSQILRQSANTLSKVSIFGVLSLVGGLVLLAIVLPRSTDLTRQHEFIEQPLQFSHMHQVADALTAGTATPRSNRQRSREFRRPRPV